MTLSTYTAIVPFWPLHVADTQNYFLQPAMVARDSGFISRVLVTGSMESTANTESIAIQKCPSVGLLLKSMPHKRVLHFHTAGKAVLFHLISSLLLKSNHTVIWTPHTSFGYRKPFNLPVDIFTLFGFMWKRVDKIITITPAEETYLKSLGYENTVLIPLPIDIDTLQKYPSPEKDNTLTTDLLFIGGDREIKGLQYVLRSIQLLNNNSTPVKLHVLGTVSPELKEEYARNGKIVFHGQITPLSHEFLDIVNNCTIYINNSFYEGPSLAAHECAALGLACCLSDLPTLRSIFGNDALYHDPLHPEDLASNINRYIRERGLMQTHSQSNRKHMRQYSLSEFKKRFHTLLTNISV